MLAVTSAYFGVRFIVNAGSDVASVAKNETSPSAKQKFLPAIFSGIKTFSVNKSDTRLIIPKINVDAPIVFPEKFDEKAILKDLNKGTVWYSNSVLPGQKGTSVILGHSANEKTPKLPYMNIFTRLDELKAGDQIIIRTNGKNYVFRVNSQMIFSPEGQEPNFALSNGANIILVTCWPDGRPWKRLGVSASLI